MPERTAQLTRYLKWIMVFSGSWRLKISDNKVIENIYNVHSSVIQLSMLWFHLSLILNFPSLLKNKDYSLVAENVGYTIITLIILMKLIICQTKKLRNLLIECILKEKSIFLGTPKVIQDNFNIHVQQVNKIYYILIPFTISVNISFCCANYMDYAQYKDCNATVTKPLVLPIWYPFDPNVYYPAAFGIGIYLTIVGSLYNTVTQVLFLNLMTYVILQLRSLKIYGENFHQYIQPCTQDDGILKILREICVEHQNIIRYIEDLNMTMRNVLLMEYLLNSLNIASLTIRIVMMSNPPVMLVFCMLLLGIQMLQLYWMSWHANEINLESISLSDSLFKSKWYEQSEKAKKIISIIMMRSRKPLVLYIGPFYPMSMGTGLATLKAAYSYVTLILTMAEG